MRNIMYLEKALENCNYTMKYGLIYDDNALLKELFNLLMGERFELLAAKVMPNSIVLFAEKDSTVSIDMKKNKISERQLTHWVEINDYEVVGCSKSLNLNNLKKLDFSKILEKHLSIEDAMAYESDCHTYNHSEVKHSLTYKEVEEFKSDLHKNKNSLFK